MPDYPIDRIKKILISGSFDFESLALVIFNFQYQHNPVYQSYIDSLKVQPKNVKTLQEIPFLPVEFFKDHEVTTTNFVPQKVYKSSGTGKTGRSMHLVSDNDFYLRNSLQIFRHFYHDADRLIIAALLPSYQEQGDSSLIAMTDYFIRRSGDELSGYFRGDPDELLKIKKSAEARGKRVLLLGVTYALLQLAESRPDFSGHIIMETGGMKGRGRELVREELHKILCSAYNVSSIHSEYGMTELMSQAYSAGDGIFQLPGTLRILLRDVNDPFSYLSNDKTGGVNVIDLANITSCSFVETKDLGRKKGNNSFEILGRFDNSDLRGCNLLLV